MDAAALSQSVLHWTDGGGDDDLAPTQEDGRERERERSPRREVEPSAKASGKGKRRDSWNSELAIQVELKNILGQQANGIAEAIKIGTAAATAATAAAQAIAGLADKISMLSAVHAQIPIQSLIPPAVQGDGDGTVVQAPANACASPTVMTVISQPPSKPRLKQQFVKGIQRARSTFQRDVDKLVPAKDKSIKDSDVIEIMADTSHGLRYPAGTKAFKAPAEQVELDKGFSHCQTQYYELKIVIPKGS